MDIVRQFSVFLVNKPGVLAQTLGAIADAHINILAMTMTDSVEHGVLRIVAIQTDKLREVLKKLNATVNETDVLCLTLSNHSGALADVTATLAAAHININYAYVTAGARGGKTTGVLKIADMKKGVKVLEAAYGRDGKKAEKKTTPRRKHVKR